MEANNPSNNHCTSSDHAVDIYYRVENSVPVTFVSSSLSIIGSLLIIITFILWKDVRRSTARILLLFLAIADLGTGVSYLTAVIGFEAFPVKRTTFNDPSVQFKVFCKTQSFFTTFFPVSSFFWTSAMGIYFVVALVFRRPKWGPKLIIILNIIGWGAPAVFLIFMTSFGFLGPPKKGNSVVPISAAWCFVSNERINHTIVYWLFEGICGKFWEVLTYFIVVICYGIIMVSHRGCCKKSLDVSTRITSDNVITVANNMHSDIINRAMHNLDLKLMLIPAMFILLRVWGCMRYFTSVSQTCTPTVSVLNNPDDKIYCLPKICYYLLFNFSFYLQAFCDPAQGFGNAVLFVLFSKTIRARFIRLFQVSFYKLIYICRYCRTSRDDSQHENSPLMIERKSQSAVVTYHSPNTFRRPLSPDQCRLSDESDVEINYGATKSTNLNYD